MSGFSLFFVMNLSAISRIFASCPGVAFFDLIKNGVILSCTINPITNGMDVLDLEAETGSGGMLIHQLRICDPVISYVVRIEPVY